MALPAKKKEKT